jgi:GT2 family glycosyltransferase
VTRDAVQDIGGFDEALGAGSPAQGGEDLDYFLRALLKGWAIAYEPAALVWHMHRRDEDSLDRQMRGYGSGLSAYITKHLLHPRTALGLARRLPRGLVRFARINRGLSKTLATPPVARHAELRGLISGPACYVRGRRRLQQHKGWVTR